MKFSTPARTAGKFAGGLLKRRFRLFNLAQTSFKKLQKNDRKRVFNRVREDSYTLLRMIKAWSQRRYTRMPWRVVLYSVGGLLYFLNPIDLIPDFLAVIGFVDDVAVLGAVVGALETEIQRFEKWEANVPGSRSSPASS